VEASYLYSDGEGSYFLDQETFDTLRLTGGMIANALDLPGGGRDCEAEQV